MGPISNKVIEILIKLLEINSWKMRNFKTILPYLEKSLMLLKKFWRKKKLMIILD